jgi:hypothetical protein
LTCGKQVVYAHAMPCPERMRLTRKVIGETKREGVLASAKSFGLDVLGIASGMAAGIGVGFSGFGGGEIIIAGKIIGFLALTMTGTYALIKSEGFVREAALAFKKVKEIRLCVGKQTLGKQDLIY